MPSNVSAATHPGRSGRHHARKRGANPRARLAARRPARRHHGPPRPHLRPPGRHDPPLASRPPPPAHAPRHSTPHHASRTGYRPHPPPQIGASSRPFRPKPEPHARRSTSHLHTERHAAPASENGSREAAHHQSPATSPRNAARPARAVSCIETVLFGNGNLRPIQSVIVIKKGAIVCFLSSCPTFAPARRRTLPAT